MLNSFWYLAIFCINLEESGPQPALKTCQFTSFDLLTPNLLQARNNFRIYQSKANSSLS